MKILMLNPPFLKKFSRNSRSPAISKGGCIYYPMWLSYATGILEQAGHEVKLVDAPAADYSQEYVVKLAKRFEAELTVVDTSTPSIFNDVNVLEKIKSETGSFGVLVGAHVSALPQEALELSKQVDAIARHEYDFTLRELAEELERKSPTLQKINGLSYRQKGGSQEKLTHNPSRPLIKGEELDQFPFVSEVYKKHLNYKDYFYPANLYPEVTIVTGRGCPYRCTYCVNPQTLMGHGYRARSVKNVAEEFEYIKNNFPEVKEVFIEDDTFTANRARVRDFAIEMEKRNLKLTWSCNARADVDLQTLQAMKRAGCRLMCVGVESADQKILNNIRKGTHVNGIRQFMKDSKKAGILVHGCFMIGNKGETKESIRKTIEFAKELDPDTAQFFPIMVYPGTEAFEWAKSNNYLKSLNWRDWLTEEGVHNCMVSTEEVSAKDLVSACDQGRMEFYMRPKYMGSKVKQALLNPKEIPRLAKSGQTFFKYLFKGSD